MLRVSPAMPHDTLSILIIPAGVAYAGIDQTVCANNSIVSLNGIISGGAGYEGINEAIKLGLDCFITGKSIKTEIAHCASPDIFENFMLLEERMKNGNP